MYIDLIIGHIMKYKLKFQNLTKQMKEMASVLETV